jgi:aspartate aminotransferase
MDDELERYLAVKRTLSGRDKTGSVLHAAIGDPGVISLAQGNGMRRPHPSVIEAGVKSLLQTSPASLETYSSNLRDADLDQEIESSFLRLGIPQPVAASICIDSGATRVLFSFMRATAQPGDHFLVGRAFYHGFASLASVAGIRLVTIETSMWDGHLITASNLAAKLAENPMARGLIFTSPTFTGEVYTATQLADLANVISAHGLPVFCDMTFAMTEHDGNFTRPALASFDGMDQFVVTAMSASKALGLANLRVGWACGPEAVIHNMNMITTATGLTVPSVAKSMAKAALRMPPQYLQENAREADDRKRLVADCVASVNESFRSSGYRHRIHIPRIPSSGSSMLMSFNDFIGLRTRLGPIRSSLDVTRFLLDTAKVAVSPCYSGGLDDATVRIAFGDVGAELTYTASQSIEAAYMTRPDGPHMPSQYADQSAYANGFEQGRKILVHAITERIGPALKELLAAQITSSVKSLSP